MRPRLAMRPCALAVVAVTVLSGATACENPADPVALEVGSDSLTRSELQDFAQGWSVANGEPGVTPKDQGSETIGVNPQLTSSFATLWTNFHGIEQWLAEQGIEVTDAQRAQARELIGEQFGPQLCSSHILVATEAEADDALARLDDGEKLEDLAAELSIDTGSGAQGGSLGCTSPGDLVPEYESAANAAAIGETVGPVESQFGFHIIRVDNKLDPGTKLVDEIVEWQAAAIAFTSDESLMRQSLQTHPEARPRTLCASHILVATEEEAQDVVDRLDDDDAFEDIAADVSIDPGSASAGGSLGCNPEGSFVAEFESAAFAADEGEVTGPVETEFGFHVILVESIDVASDEDSLAQVSQIVQGELIQGTSGFYPRIFEGRHVKVDPRFGDWDATSFSIRVPGGASSEVAPAP